jgi:hypothetical protein
LWRRRYTVTRPHLVGGLVGVELFLRRLNPKLQNSPSVPDTYRAPSLDERRSSETAWLLLLRGLACDTLEAITVGHSNDEGSVVRRISSRLTFRLAACQRQYRSSEGIDDNHCAWAIDRALRI